MNEHQKQALETIGVSEEQFHEAIREEAEIRSRPQTKFTINELKRSGNPKLAKLANQYQLGLMTWDELEFKVREVIG